MTKEKVLKRGKIKASMIRSREFRGEVNSQPLFSPPSLWIKLYSIDLQKPYSLIVGRITRQKGLTHLLKAAKNFDPHIQVVLCASAPDTPEIAAEVDQLVAELRALRGLENIINPKHPMATVLFSTFLNIN